VGVKPTNDLVETYWPDAYRIAYSVLRNHADAEDAAQEACAQMHVALPNLRDERAFKGWFYRIAIRKAYELLRSRRRRGAEDSLDIAAPASIADDTLDLGRALERLPQTQRLAVIFHYYYGFPDNDVAAILGTTHAAVRVRLFMARRALRRLLETDSIFEGNVCHEHQ
jgi:RNA polymerase sigma-70 factor (ECF subfamily)